LIRLVAKPFAPPQIRRMNALRDAIRGQVDLLMGTGGRAEPLPARAPGDDGLFGRDSAAWQVHGDLGTMMIGGVSALLLQMLHPGALAGVWDHSNFREDMTGRLQRTARFISATTYGSTASAEAMIARVRRVHGRVTGVLPDGTRYSAEDPALLAWVHAAETRSFLAAYVRFRDPLFPRVRQDRYFAEMAALAKRLGAGDVPRTREANDAYLRAMRPALKADARTRDVAQVLLGRRAATPASYPLQSVMLEAGVDLLPEWARVMHGRDAPLTRRLAVRTGALGAGAVLRWALRPARTASR
jgi:uncharacterized protein (DUF2236 family)